MVVHYATHQLMKFHHTAGTLPRECSVLDIGQVEWGYQAHGLLDDINQFGTADRREPLRQRLFAAAKVNDVFGIGRIYYDLYFSPVIYDTIDLHGTAQALKLNLNHPIQLERQYDVVLNNGTAEHVFNIGQVFQTIHDHTKPGGLMVHEVPFTGFLNHGFYNINPVLMFDLATANNYEILSLHACAHGYTEFVEIKSADDGAKCDWPKSADSNLICYLRKSKDDSKFKLPQQGVYARFRDGTKVEGD